VSLFAIRYSLFADSIAAHSTLMFAALMIGNHFSTSVL
jgi:hypothetical protein